MRANKYIWNTVTTRLETPASDGRGENSVRAMKEMIQRQKDAVFTLGIEFSTKHHLFASVGAAQWVDPESFGAQ